MPITLKCAGLGSPQRWECALGIVEHAYFYLRIKGERTSLRKARPLSSHRNKDLLQIRNLFCGHCSGTSSPDYTSRVRGCAVQRGCCSQEVSLHVRQPSSNLRLALLAVTCSFALGHRTASSTELEIVGITVTPHVIAEEMRYARARDESLGARVQLFLRNKGSSDVRLSADEPPRFRDRTPEDLVRARQWAWHDTPSSWPDSDTVLPPGALTVWQFNSTNAEWGVGTEAELQMSAGVANQKLSLKVEAPDAWISAVTFLATGEQIRPDRVVLHIANQTAGELRLSALRLWLPVENKSWRTLLPGPTIPLATTFPSDGGIPGGEKGGAVVDVDPLPLTYAAVEVQCFDADDRPRSLWARLRIKREVFDISGGWVGSTMGNRNTLQHEPFLKALRRMHVNTAHIADTPGYTDDAGNEGLYTRYPLKYFNKLEPTSHYDTDAMLPRIHAVEFLGEPQYGGGRPVPPMEVWRQLAPYQSKRLATTVTHSEERVWRLYAGLSDYPHYDAYRVTAPSPDAWWKYDRWQGESIRWGAPLESIGAMSRSLREPNRPMPTAYWSQGPHAGWDGYGGRKRTSPTPDELRLQAYHALSSRITSLYWFNLSLRSLVKFPDLIDEVTRVGREIRLLDDIYLAGDAYHYERILRDGKPDWDLATIATPNAGLFFALDLAYVPDQTDKVFRFSATREVSLRFPLPPHLRQPVDVFRVDADGTHDVRRRVEDSQLTIDDSISKVAVYFVATDGDTRKILDSKIKALLAYEQLFRFDPAKSPADLAVLKGILDAAK